MNGNPDRTSTAVIQSLTRSESTGCFLEHTRGDLLSNVARDRELPALPTEPLVGHGISPDCEPERLRLPAIFVHPSLQTR